MIFIEKIKGFTILHINFVLHILSICIIDFKNVYILVISVVFLCPSDETFNGAPCQAQDNNPIHLITQKVVSLVCSTRASNEISELKT